MSREHVADFGGAAVWAADHGKSLEREGAPCAVPEQILETLEIARHKSLGFDEGVDPADIGVGS